MHGTVSQGIHGSIGPENFAGDQFGEYDFSDHEMADPRRLNPDEERKRGDPRFDLDLEFLPHTFATPQDTLDAYNEIGYRVKIQFRLYEQKRKMGRIMMFSLCCAMRNNPKFLPRYAGGNFTKLS